MIGLLWLVVYILIAAAVGYLLWWALGIAGVPERVRQIVVAILAIVVVIWVLTWFVGQAPMQPMGM